ncbi:MAG: hypothetical protein IKQ90_03400 [Ruminococcus sp.]|nr:hypothetical protein [Ruminococcus sp.]
MENEKTEELTDTGISPEDDTSQLLQHFEGRSRRKKDDVPAMQAALCILCAAAVLAADAISPGMGKQLFRQIKELSADGHELFPNPLKLLFAVMR